MIDSERLDLKEAELLSVAADAIIVEDNGRLLAQHGNAAALAMRYAELRLMREQAVPPNSPLPLGSALAFRADDGTIAVWAVTYGEAVDGQPVERTRATPLDIAAAAREALLRAAEHGARQVALPALGTRYGHHVLPAVPKKLPRYVMAAAQLIGIREALEHVSFDRITLCLTQRDRAIFAAVLGLGTPNEGSDDA